jgi:hypothetical protein
VSYTPGPSIEIVTLVALVVLHFAVNSWNAPLWQSMLSGVEKLLISGAVLGWPEDPGPVGF